MAVSDKNGTVTMLGSGGSNRIRTALVQVLLHLIDRDQSLETAIMAPRLHMEAGVLNFEDRFSEGDREALLNTWPEANLWPEDSMFFGGVHAVRRNAKGDCDAFGDPRRAGSHTVA